MYVNELCRCAVLWFARSKDQVSLGGRLVFSVHLLWPALLKGWQERSAGVATPSLLKGSGMSMHVTGLPVLLRAVHSPAGTGCGCKIHRMCWFVGSQLACRQLKMRLVGIF